jgi:hypothetical protein
VQPGRNAALAPGGTAGLYRAKLCREIAMGKLLGVAAAFAVTLGLAALPAHGAITTGEVARALEARGHQANIGVDDDGDPKVTSNIDDVHLTVFFYGCDHGRSCQSITFQAAFHVDGGVPLEKINGWNRDKRFLKTWLDKVNDPFCEMDVNAEPGLTPAQLIGYVGLWEDHLAEYKGYMDF